MHNRILTHLGFVKYFSVSTDEEALGKNLVKIDFC